LRFTKKLSPPNSIILIMNVDTGVPPRSFFGRRIATTNSCVAVTTLNEFDGETTISFTDEATIGSHSTRNLIFDGSIDVQGRELSVVSAHNEVLMTLPLGRNFAHVSIESNELDEPSEIFIFVE
jgi:hypothetical protein